MPKPTRSNQDRRLTDFPVVEVRWHDASSYMGWADWPEVEEHAPELCMTYGRLTHKTRAMVKVAQNIGETGHCGNIMAIPTPWIVSIRTLKRGKR